MPARPAAHPAPRRRAADAVPLIETVRITPRPEAPCRDGETHGRLVIAAWGFALLFLAVVGKLADATILQPLLRTVRTGRSPRCSRTVPTARSPVRQCAP